MTSSKTIKHQKELVLGLVPINFLKVANKTETGKEQIIKLCALQSTNYQTLCFTKHKKECIICGENKIVAVHHMNEDHSDDRIENLIPLCPTHHQYMHSRYKAEILPKVEEYVEKFKLGLA